VDSEPAGDVPGASPRRRRTNPDEVMRHLVRMVLDETRSTHSAARRLLDMTAGDLPVLRHVRARLIRASMKHHTPVTERALDALDHALRRGPSPDR
jgi:hypothetical protein